MNLLNHLPIIGPLRRNHALEHASLHVLSLRHPQVAAVGHSGPRGFSLICKLSSEEATKVVLEAWHRLNRGEVQLAVHPNCGTNLVVSILLASGAFSTVLALLKGRNKSSQPWHYLVSGAVAVPVFIFSKPLGILTQKQLTTSPELGHTAVLYVNSTQFGDSYLHRFSTSS